MTWHRTAAAALLALGLTGCAHSAGHDVELRASACDDGPGALNREEAVRTLLHAAEHSDTEEACTVIMVLPQGTDLGEELDRLREDAQLRGITSENARLAESGSPSEMPIHRVTGPSETSMGPLQFQFERVTDHGLRVMFPPMEERSA